MGSITSYIEPEQYEQMKILAKAAGLSLEDFARGVFLTGMGKTILNMDRK